MAALLNRSETEWQRLVIQGPPPLGPGAPAIERLHAFGHSRMEVNLQHAELIRAAGRAGERSYAAVSFAAMHVRYLLEPARRPRRHRLPGHRPARPAGDGGARPADAHRRDPARPASSTAGTTWSAASSAREVNQPPPPDSPHQPGGCRSCQGAAASTWAQRRAAAPPRPDGRRASRRPAGRRGSSAAAARRPGMPVTFHAEVHGVNRFCASKSAAGSSSSRIAPTGSGGYGQGRGQHGVVRRQRGQRAGRDPAQLADRQPELRPAHRAAALGEPAGQRPQQRAPARAARRDSAVSTAQQVSKTGTASARQRHRRRPRPRGRATPAAARRPPRRRRHSGSTAASAITGSMNRAIRSRPGSRSQAARNVPTGGGAQDGSPTRRPASTSSIAAASRTVRAIGPAVAKPTGSPYMG